MGDVLSEPSTAPVQLAQVSYRYPSARGFALRDISLTVRRGEFLGIIGPTGAGKTTLCLALNGIVPQFYGGKFYGRITVAGLDTLSVPVNTLARYVGTVFEDPETQLVTTSVENEVAFALENLSVPRAEMRSRISWALQVVRLAGYEKRHPYDLSAGQKQRLAIAAALAVRPALLVLDEPTSQLDPMGVREVFAVVRRLNRELGMTLVMVSHAAEAMAEYADRVAVLDAGRLVALGTPRQVYAQVGMLQGLALRPPQVTRTFHLIGQWREVRTPLPVRMAEARPRLPHLAAQLPPSCPPPPPPAEHQSPPQLSVRHLSHTFGDGTQALRDVSLEIRAGEYVLIAGQNGGGKTTLVKHFLNLLQPTAGQVLLDGVETRTLPISTLARRIGYVAQNPDQQIFSTTVQDEVAFALRNLGVPPDERRARVRGSLTAMRLWERRDAHPLALPRGDRTRVVIAAVLAMRPDIIVFDEPTTGQDFRGARAILEITHQLHRQGKTVIVITHHLYLMAAYAERMIVLRDGQLLLDAPLRAALREEQTLAQAYLAPPQAVQLARALGQLGARPMPWITPEEVAACFAPDGGRV